MTTEQRVTEHPVPGSGPYAITAGPDDALWFTETATDTIGRITTDGTIDAIPLPTPDSEPHGLTVGPDGAIWAALEPGTLARVAK